MRHRRVDYDRLSVSYDSVKTLPPQTAATWTKLLLQVLKPYMDPFVLDVGCGTGRFARMFLENPRCIVTALDPSDAMLDRLRPLSSSRLRCVAGVAEQLPFSDGSYDLIFMSSVIHHFSDILLAFREAHRVLRADGRICVRFASRSQLYSRLDCRFFPQLKTVFSSRLDYPVIADSIRVAGFARLQAQEVRELFVTSPRQYLDKLAGPHSSALAALSRTDFENGVRRAQDHFRSHNLTENDMYESMTLLVGQKNATT